MVAIILLAHSLCYTDPETRHYVCNRDHKQIVTYGDDNPTGRNEGGTDDEPVNDNPDSGDDNGGNNPCGGNCGVGVGNGGGNGTGNEGNGRGPRSD